MMSIEKLNIKKDFQINITDKSNRSKINEFDMFERSSQ